MHDQSSEHSSLMVICHPNPNSLCGRIADRAAVTLSGRGSKVVVHDLYRMNFNPLLSEEEFATYHTERIPQDIISLVAGLRAACELIFILPIWMFDMPAVLKGYFDRIWRPSVAFDFDGTELRPLLFGIERLTVVVTHGRSEVETSDTGDGSRVFFRSSLPTLLPKLKANTRFDFYAFDKPDDDAIERQISCIFEHLCRERI